MKNDIVPAEELLGLTLNEGWTVVERVQRGPNSTGGCFSVGYIAKNAISGKLGYVKALDLKRGFDAQDPTGSLLAMLAAYEFERNVCERCNGHKLDRVIAAVASGTLKTDESDVYSVVPYLVFHKAEGDIRKQLDSLDRLDVAWALRCLHNIATGLQQLHGVDVAHQDVKPSNVLVFNQEGSKLADLGRACVKGEMSPHERAMVAGDPRYAPPESLYNASPVDWNERRLGCDLYHLGSMAVFLFSRCNVTALLLDEIPEGHRPWEWSGTYDEVLPYVRDAFGRAVARFSADVPEDLCEELVTALRQLCDPSPQLRGHPLSRAASNPFSLERYVSLFDKLATRAEIQAKGGIIGRV